MSDDIMLVDEIKSIRVNPEVIPEYVLEQFWRQACFYAFMLASEMDVAEVLVRLCLFHLDEEQEYQLEQLFSVGELTFKFAEAILVLVDRLESRRQWRQIRSKANKTLSFPYPNYRPGQRDLADCISSVGNEWAISAPGTHWYRKNNWNVVPGVTCTRKDRETKNILLVG